MGRLEAEEGSVLGAFTSALKDRFASNHERPSVITVNYGKPFYRPFFGPGEDITGWSGLERHGFPPADECPRAAGL